MDQNGVHRADADKVTAFDLSAVVQHQYRETFAIRVELGRCRNVHPQIIGHQVGGVTNLKAFSFQRLGIPQRRHLVKRGEGQHLLDHRQLPAAWH